MPARYDLVVIGGGPAGAATAWRASEGGATTLLLERDREIGLPVRCGEMASLDLLQRLVPVPQSLVANTVEQQELTSPEGHSFLFPERGVILDRERFDAYLAELACRAGSEVLTRADATGMSRIEDGWGVRFTHDGSPQYVEARLVVAADGVESRVARWAGIDTALPLDELASCAQYDVVNLSLEHPHRCVYYLGNRVAPGGYAWIFPKSPTRANVGVGVLASRTAGRPAKYYLDRFVEERLPWARHARFVCGGVPLARPLKETIADRLMIVGDAARLADPLTGAGILAAIESGLLAGQAALEARNQDCRHRKHLERYAQRCRKEVCKMLPLLYSISRIYKKMSDEQLNRVHALLRELDAEKFTTLDLCRIVLREHPGLLASLPKLLLQLLQRPAR